MKPTPAPNDDAKPQRPGDRDSARSVSEDGTRAPGPLTRARRCETGLSVTPGLTISEPTHWELLGGATPHWITTELVEQTLRTWQPYYSSPLTSKDAIDMIRNAGRLFDALSGK